MLMRSLGGMYPAPPKTRRGTIEKPIAAVAAWSKNLRRDTTPFARLQGFMRFFTVPSQSQLTSTPAHRGFTTEGIGQATSNEASSESAGPSGRWVRFILQGR